MDMLPLFLLFLVLLTFGGGILSVIQGYGERRHKRLEADAKRQHELAMITERRTLAQLTGEAVQLVIADPTYAADFDRRLQEAMRGAGMVSGVRIADEETESAATATSGQEKWPSKRAKR